MKKYGSFLVRCWVIEDGVLPWRTIFNIEHIQSGAWARDTSLTEAQDWIISQCQKASPAEEPPLTDCEE